MSNTSQVLSDIPFKAYQQIQAINISQLCMGFISAAHMKAAIDGRLKRKDETADMVMGRAIHARLLEPEHYRSMFVVEPACQAVLKTGEKKGQPCSSPATHTCGGFGYCGRHCPADATRIENALSRDEFARVERVAEMVSAHSVVRLLKQQGGCETTVEWERDGQPCKARLDKWIPPNAWLKDGAIVDLKKVQSGRASPAAVESAIWEYHYDVKAAWYVDAIKEALGYSPTFVWLFLEDDEPFGISAIQADYETLMAGRIRYEGLWSMYLQGQQTGVWPGYPMTIQVGGLAEWAKKRVLGR